MEHITPGSDEEIVLRFLAKNPETAYPPKYIVENTEINPETIAETMSSLHEKGLVANKHSRYSIPENCLDVVNGLLGDLQNLGNLVTEPSTGTVHKDDVVDRDNTQEVDPSRASKSEINDLIDFE